MKTRHIHTEHSTPCTLAVPSYLNISDFHMRSLNSSQIKIMGEVTNTAQSSTTSLSNSQVRISNSQQCLTHRKPSKISIMPLTREKVRVHKVRRRVEDCDSSVQQLNNHKRKSPVESSGKAYVQFFTMLSFMYNKMKRKCFKLEVLIQDLIGYFSHSPEKEWGKEVADLLRLADVIKGRVVEEGPQLRYDTVKQCQGELSKLFFNICYQIYLYKHNQQTLPLLSLIHRDVEYYSRRLGLLNLAILTCMDMGRLYSEYSDLQRAAEEYNKAVKLAVYVGDKYSQEVAIDRLGMCEYYKGDIVSAHYFHTSTDKLSAYDKWKVFKYYSNENEIQKILQEKIKEKSLEESIKQQFFRKKENYEFNFEVGKDTEFVQKNYETFRTNLKEMIKVNSLRKRVPLIKHALIRAEQVGDRDYRGRDYCIPRASKYYSKTSGRSREECLLSHRSYNRNTLASDSARIDKHCKIIDQILNFIVNEQKGQIRSIKEERQSIISEDNNT